MLIFRVAEYVGVGDAAYEPAATQPWASLLGQTVQSCGLAWHVSEDGYPASVWAVRLDFPRTSVVFALGEWRDELAYNPDEIVVIFDRLIAEGYRPAHVEGSAWGPAEALRRFTFAFGSHPTLAPSAGEKLLGNLAAYSARA